jgi:hypothetical protein
MDTPTRTEPPYVPLRHSRWVTHRTPRWVWLAGALILMGAVVVGIAVHPSRSQRATDMNGFLADMKTDIQSCSGGVRESLQALRAIRTGASHDVATAVRIASYGAANCSPANNVQLDDLTQYQVHESLASFHLNLVVDDLVTWAFPYAQRVQNDVAGILRSKGAAQAAATAKLGRDLRILDAQRARIDNIILPAIKATGATAKLPPLAG